MYFSQLFPQLILHIVSALWWREKGSGVPITLSRVEGLEGREVGRGVWHVDGTEGRGCAFGQDTFRPVIDASWGGCPRTAQELMQGSSTS